MKKTIRDKVRELMKDSQKCRNSDIELYIQHLQKYCTTDNGKTFIRAILERAGTNIAGLTRERAHIQNKEGLYLSEKQIKKFRDEKEEEKRLDFSPAGPSTY